MLKEPGYNTSNKPFMLVCCSEGWIKKCTHGQPKKTWQQCVSCDLKSLKLSKVLTSKCHAWREALRIMKSPTCKKCATWAQSR